MSNYFNNNLKRKGSITDFERKLFKSVENELSTIGEIRVCEGYSEIVYSSKELESIGEIVIEEEYALWLASQGRDYYEEKAQEEAEYESWIVLQCDLAEKETEEGNTYDATQIF